MLLSSTVHFKLASFVIGFLTFPIRYSCLRRPKTYISPAFCDPLILFYCCIGNIVAIMLDLRTLLSVSSTCGTVCQQTVCIFPPLWHSNEQSNKLILRRFYLVSRLRFLDVLLLVPLRGLLIHSHIVFMHSLFWYCCFVWCVRIKWWWLKTTAQRWASLERPPLLPIQAAAFTCPGLAVRLMLLQLCPVSRQVYKQHR